MNAIERALRKLRQAGEIVLVFGWFATLLLARDPLVQMTLEREDFATLGKWLTEIDIPAGAILEGGYSDDLPDSVS